MAMARFFITPPGTTTLRMEPTRAMRTPPAVSTPSTARPLSISTAPAVSTWRTVTFRYEHELDPRGTAQFGLVAEEVEKIDPALVVHDAQGKPYSVRYDAVNAMLLNELQKEHHKVQEQDKTIAELKASLARQQ